jgi:hypothetical protein
MDNSRVFRIVFASVYPHYVLKAEKKGRTKEELDTVTDFDPMRSSGLDWVR